MCRRSCVVSTTVYGTDPTRMYSDLISKDIERREMQTISFDLPFLEAGPLIGMAASVTCAPRLKLVYEYAIVPHCCFQCAE